MKEKSRLIIPLEQRQEILTNESKLFHDEGCYHMETSLFICSANQWTGFYVITAPVMKELK